MNFYQAGFYLLLALSGTVLWFNSSNKQMRRWAFASLIFGAVGLIMHLLAAIAVSMFANVV